MADAFWTGKVGSQRLKSMGTIFTDTLLVSDSNLGAVYMKLVGVQDYLFCVFGDAGFDNHHALVRESSTELKVIQGDVIIDWFDPRGFCSAGSRGECLVLLTCLEVHLYP